MDLLQHGCPKDRAAVGASYCKRLEPPRANGLVRGCSAIKACQSPKKACECLKTPLMLDDRMVNPMSHFLDEITSSSAIA